jgi:hypothetical protein
MSRNAPYPSAANSTHQLSGKYHALREYTRQLLDEAETILRRTKSAAVGRYRERAPTGEYIGTAAVAAAQSGGFVLRFIARIGRLKGLGVVTEARRRAVRDRV